MFRSTSTSASIDVDARETVHATPIHRDSDRPVSLWPRQPIQTSSYFRFKYTLEPIIAALLAIPAIPVVLILICLVRVTSRGPAIYRQKRVGLNRRVFSIYKIRTMEMDAESNSGPKWSSPDDPRVTGLGRVLRSLHLDELPQLVNVIMGDMSIIGPRPERPEFVNVLIKQVDHYTDRLNVKPGITGLAQIYLPPDETTDCVRRKVCFDRAYINTASPLVDVQIWLCTIVRILGIRKGRGPRWFGLDRRFEDVIRHCGSIGSEPDRIACDLPFQKNDIAATSSGKAVCSSSNGHTRHDSAHSENGSPVRRNKPTSTVRPR